MITVCIESPLAGDFATNIAYARACLRYCLEQGVSPYASHLLLPQVYDDLDEAQREAGIQAGLAMGDRCIARWFFMDLGMSPGMQRAWDREAEALRRLIEKPPTDEDGESSIAMALEGARVPSQFYLGDDWHIRYPATPTPGFGV